MSRFSQRKLWLIGLLGLLGSFAVIAIPIAIGIVTNVITSERPLHLLQNLFSQERRWLWGLLIVLSFVLGWQKVRKQSQSNPEEPQQRQLLCKHVRLYLQNNDSLILGTLNDKIPLKWKERPDLLASGRKDRESYVLDRKP